MQIQILPYTSIILSILFIGCAENATNKEKSESARTSLFIEANPGSVFSRNFDMDGDLTPLETLGKLLFFDGNLSEPAGQSCASCHAPMAGFADPDEDLPVSEGVIPGNFGARNALSSSYVKFTPSFDIGLTPDETIGGLFWDGRKLDLEDQAKAPFLNPLEMNNPSLDTVVADVMIASYAPLFLNEFGPTAFDDPVLAYEFIAQAIAAYERSAELNKFNSKYDLFKAGLVDLSPEEALGLSLFTGKAHCDHCHVLNSLEDPTMPDLFTNHKYANIGLPRNTEFPYDLMPPDTVDLGLGAITGDALHNGKFKTPHLRNVELTAPYMHNGIFKTLYDVVHFYNTRDVHAHVLPPEVPENMVTASVGDLGLTPDEEEAIVEFLETLTDEMPLPALVATAADDDDEDKD